MSQPTFTDALWREPFPDPRAVGKALAAHFAWDHRILEACIVALDDANFHEAAAWLTDHVDRLHAEWQEDGE